MSRDEPSLADAMRAVADALEALQEDGLVESEPDPEDGRRNLYALTEAAIADSEREKRHAEAVFG